MASTTILISGLGIAGPTLAFWLRRAGFEPVVVERAAAPRSGGFVIDFWGLGYDIAELMGLADDIKRAGYRIHELRIVDDHGDRVAGFGTAVFETLTGGRFSTIARSDLSRLLFERIEGTTEVRFGDEIVALDERADHVDVTFARAGTRRFDLVVGADGLQSAVRRLAFGPRERFEKPLGYLVAAFESDGYPTRDEGVYVIHGAPGRMIGRVALRDDRTLFLSVFSWPANVAPPADAAAQRALVRARLADGGWECGPICAALDRAETLYVDRVSQIRMDRWSRGRIALVGDAAACLSLTAGQGSALAMAEAYVLAGELAAASGRPDAAFGRYEARLRPFIERKQRAAGRFAAAFAPASRWGLRLRNLAINAMAIPKLAELTLGREIADRLPLPDYPDLS